MAAHRDQSGPARVRDPDRALEIPARKVFWEATPAAEVAAPVPPVQASSVLRRANAASIPPNTKRQHRLPNEKEQSVHRGICALWRSIDDVPVKILGIFEKESSVLRSLLDSVRRDHDYASH